MPTKTIIGSLFLGIFLGITGSTPASANLGLECKRHCAPLIVQCWLNGEPRRRCKKRYVRLCKNRGFAACDTTTTTITPTSLPPTTSTTTTTLPDRLSVLLGRWAFTYTIISTFTDHYDLTTITPAIGEPYNIVRGINSDLGNDVVAARVQDLDPGSTTGYEFALLDPEGSLLCEFFEFNVGGASTATGEVLFLYGDCATPVSGSFHVFNGVKY